jgi:hypothetical protein
MNTLIRLFQLKADNALERFQVARRQACKLTIPSTEWNENVAEGIKAKTEAETWQKAADILRKEELSR